VHGAVIIVTALLLDYGMIATGNHRHFDSLRDAPRSVSQLRQSTYHICRRVAADNSCMVQ
jgi:hypothetical protein